MCQDLLQLDLLVCQVFVDEISLFHQLLDFFFDKGPLAAEVAGSCDKAVQQPVRGGTAVSPCDRQLEAEAADDSKKK